MAVISIDYKEGSKRKDLGYKGVEISYANLKKQKKFTSGDFVKDWYDCNKFIITKLYEKEGHFSNSSSVNHFIMDGAPFISAYLVSTDKSSELFYGHTYYQEGIEFFVKENTKPTWHELRKMCGDPFKPKK